MQATLPISWQWRPPLRHLRHRHSKAPTLDVRRDSSAIIIQWKYDLLILITTILPFYNCTRSAYIYFYFLSFSLFLQENNKSPNRNKFATPKSPSRKTKARLAKTNLNKTNFNELNERNRNEKEKSETITSEKAIANANALNTQSNNIHCAITLQKQCAGVCTCY